MADLAEVLPATLAQGYELDSCRASCFCHRQRDDEYPVAIRNGPERRIHSGRQLDLAVIATRAPLVKDHLFGVLPLFACPHLLVAVIYTAVLSSARIRLVGSRSQVKPSGLELHSSLLKSGFLNQ